MYSEINLSISDENYSSLALMYFDPTTEGLKELDDSVLYFEISPYESSIRRFYLTGNLLTNIDTLLSVSVNLDTPQKNNYEAKVLIGSENPRLYNFDNAIHIANTKYTLSPSYFANAIPVDILISSKSETESIVILDIKIEANKSLSSTSPLNPLISCDGATSTSGCISLVGSYDIELNGSIISTNIDAANTVSSLHQISELKATSCNIHNYQLTDASFIFNASATANTPTKAALEYIVYLKTFEALADLDIQIISATSAQVDVVAYRPNGNTYPMQPWGVTEFVNPNIINMDNTSTQYQRLRLLPNIGANALIVDSSNPTLNIDNNVISVCLAPAEQVQISCDGATDVFSIYHCYPKENFTVAKADEVRLYNGSIENPNGFGFEYINTDSNVEPPYDYKDNYRVTESFRFELKFLPENQDQYYMKFGGDNPTIVQLGSNHWGVCLAPATSCVPSEPLEFTAAWNQLVSHKRLTFSINGSPPSIFTGLPEVGDDDADISFEEYFYRFGVANRVEGNYFIISTSGGNQGAFRLGFDGESGQAIISARDDSYNPLSTTLEIIATDHPDDFATHYFGGSVTLHACGISEPA